MADSGDWLPPSLHGGRTGSSHWSVPRVFLACQQELDSARAPQALWVTQG